MSVLRVASLTVTALWIGGLSALVAIAVRALSAVLHQQDSATGSTLAAQIIGNMFGRFQNVSWFLGGSLIALLALRAALGPRPRCLAVQVTLVTTMLIANAFMLSTALIAVTLGAGLTLFWIEAKD